MKLAFHPAARLDFDELIDDITDRAGLHVADQQLARAHSGLLTIE